MKGGSRESPVRLTFPPMHNETSILNVKHKINNFLIFQLSLSPEFLP